LKTDGVINTNDVSEKRKLDDCDYYHENMYICYCRHPYFFVYKYDFGKKALPDFNVTWVFLRLWFHVSWAYSQWCEFWR